MTLKLKSTAIRYENRMIYVLDQQKLPHEEVWVQSNTPQEMVEIIRSLKVRGAPLIGVAAVLALAQLAEKGASLHEIREAAEQLKNARPTAVNLAACVDRVIGAALNAQNYPSVLVEAVREIFDEDVQLCEKMGEAGAELIQPGENILTYCNTGSLATVGIGTALGVIKKAHQNNKGIHVFACETRPLLQGGRLTAWELELAQIPHTLICDNMAGHLMKSGEIDRVLVGADRIAANGDFANKIGTYSLAVLAYHHHIPFHVVAPYTTIDLSCPNGEHIVIEERAAHEVKGASGSFGHVRWSPENTTVYNPAFDVTPEELVTSFILDSGVLTRDSKWVN